MILSVVVILLLVALNGVFAMGELALISARRARLAVLVRRGMPGAERARALSEDPQSFLPTVQVGITLVSILEGTFGGDSIAARLEPRLAKIHALAPFAHELSLVLCVLVITALMLVLGELVPKQLALRHPETIAARLSLPLLILSRVASPAVLALGWSSSLVLRLIGVTKMAKQQVTEEELKALIAEGAQAGVLEIEERNMIERLLRLADRPVRAIMTPRNEVFWIDRSADPETLRAMLKGSQHSRLLVCDGGIDDPVGLIRATDVLDRMLDGGLPTVAEVMLPPVVVPDTISVYDVLEQLRTHPLGMVLVLDEYGSFEGVATSADVFEAIVGEQQEPGHGPQSHAATDAVLVLDGASPADEIKDRLGLEELPAEGSYHTLGGLVLALLKRVPAVDDKIVFQGWLFEVLEMDGRRVAKVRASRQALAEN